MISLRQATSTQDASSGGHSGAAVNSVTKSGTNAFHGDLFEFLRNSAVNGRDAFARTDDKLKRNLYGGVVGGPVKKDKLFFFVGYQATKTRQSPSDQTEFVPTALMQAGNFSAFLANNCGTLRPTAVGSNGVLTGALSPAALFIAKKLPQTSDPAEK